MEIVMDKDKKNRMAEGNRCFKGNKGFKRLKRLVVLFVLLGFSVTILFTSRPTEARNTLPGMLPKKVFPMELKEVTAKTKVGSWVEYSTKDIDKKQRFTWRIALVGKEGKNKKWWEYVLTWGRLRSVIIKVLIESTKHDPAKVKKMIWKPAGHQAVYLPVEKGKKMMELYSPRFKGKVKKVSTGPLTVVGGTFKSDHFKAKDRRGRKIQFWVSEGVPVIGLVKLLSPGMRLELVKYGQNAKSMITEKPGKLPFPVK